MAKDNAIRNAFQLMDMILIELKSTEIRPLDQYTLREYQS